MSKIIPWSKLEVKLISCLLFSLVVSIGFFFLVQYIFGTILDNYFNKTSYIENQKNEAISEFRSYVQDEGLSIKDRDKITRWVHDEKYVILYLYENNTLVYASSSDDTLIANEDLLGNQVAKAKPYYNIAFTDANVKMYLECYFEYKYYYMIGLLGIALSFICFILVILFFINKKTSYIEKLEKEIKILEGGDLNYQITIKGNDELSSLAQSINEMRKSFIERLDNEDKARLANSELVTAMSHDLRTPLTALVGYLDIIELKKYKTDENLAQYIHSSREKAYQIKHLSDKLFEYFTVFNTVEDDLIFETFDGIQLIDQLIAEHFLALQNYGFDVKYDIASYPSIFYIEVNLISLRRVFDNIFSNIIKYADRLHPIKIKCEVEDGKLIMGVENQVKGNALTANSTGIGMKTCKKIIEKHQGEIDTIRTEDAYSVRITMPIHSAVAS